MKLIKPSVRIIEQPSGEIGMYKHIEYAMRTCYASRDKITDDSYKGMIELAKTSSHGSVLEHGTVYLKAPWSLANDAFDATQHPLYKYNFNPYSKVVQAPTSELYVTTNYRVLVENGWLEDLQYMCEPTEYHEKRVTVDVITSIGISREWNRHRSLSISEQSTRYCNFSKDKFGNEVSFIIPSWCKELKEGEYSRLYNCTDLNSDEYDFADYLFMAECNYFNLIAKEFKPQQARDILPLDTKTEVVYTGFISDWEKVFMERSSIAVTSKPHPDIVVLMDLLYKEFISKKYLEPLI